MRAEAILPAGTWDTAAAIDRVLIDFDRRHGAHQNRKWRWVPRKHP